MISTDKSKQIQVASQSLSYFLVGKVLFQAHNYHGLETYAYFQQSHGSLIVLVLQPKTSMIVLEIRKWKPLFKAVFQKAKGEFLGKLNCQINLPCHHPLMRG